MQERRLSGLGAPSHTVFPSQDVPRAGVEGFQRRNCNTIHLSTPTAPVDSRASDIVQMAAIPLTSRILDLVPQPLVDEATVALASSSEMSPADPSHYDVPLHETAQSHAATITNPRANSLDRDALLSYAYWLYDSRPENPPGLTHVPIFEPLSPALSSEDPYRLRLLPLLTTLSFSYPKYIPILLLLACTYHTLGEYEACLRVSHEILDIDPTYAEAMCNIGTTSRMLGRNEQAFEWWWKALRIRPTYWDASDHVIGLLFSLALTAESSQRRAILYARAMDICQHILREVTYPHGRLKVELKPSELHRLQRVYFTSASLRVLSTNNSNADATADYFAAIEHVIRLPAPAGDDVYTMRGLILSSYIIGLSMSYGPDGALPKGIKDCLHVSDDIPFLIRLNDPSFDVFRIVRDAGDGLVETLLREGRGALPFLLLLPDQATQLPTLLFRSSGGILPAMGPRKGEHQGVQVVAENIQRTNLMTSTILLTLAKKYQDLSSTNVYVPGFTNHLNVNHSLSILLYYLAVALTPAPSTYNNMGIILATITSFRRYVSDTGELHTLNGPALAKLYYEAGLNMDSSHPHLLTNLGSLYKDQGHIDEAIQLYTKAVASKPDFDIALANLGNAVKDAGRAWEAIEYYRRAVAVNPDLPEAVCGLSNSLISICDWRGKGGLRPGMAVDDDGNIAIYSGRRDPLNPGYVDKMIEICESQINLAYTHNLDTVGSTFSIEEWIQMVQRAYGRSLKPHEHDQWISLLRQFYEPQNGSTPSINEGGFLLRFIHWLQLRLQRRWYLQVYGRIYSSNSPVERVDSGASKIYLRPSLPKIMVPPVIPSILPFNTFSLPLSARLVRLIAHRHSLRISYTALTQSWLPPHVYPPPSPPYEGKLRIAYISNDVNDHPLAHLMQSVFGMHDRQKFLVYLYTTSAWDGTVYRPKIAEEVEHFVDASTWSTEQIIEDIGKKQVHILINLGGYTKGARNDVLAARPCPVQMQIMGYAGTLGAGWCDYLLCDPVACPRELSAPEQWRLRQRDYFGNFTNSSIGSKKDVPLDLGADLDPEALSEDWIYSEKFLYMPFTFMVTDHKQSFRNDESYQPGERLQIAPESLWADEEMRRAELRQATFTDLPQDYFIFANFNQLYKIDPEVFAAWLRILLRVPRSILWLLRFPGAGEEHILRTARLWAGEEAASRIRFGDVARKETHILRCRVADLFLDTIECNAHTIAADVLWSGTPILTWPRYTHKMCSRVCASMVNATGFGDQMVATSLQEYEQRAVAWANGVRYQPAQLASGQPFLKPQGDIVKLRRNLFLNRDRMPLFDTQRWVRNIEKAYVEAWRRWVAGTAFELSDEWWLCEGTEKESGCISVPDNDPVNIIHYED